MQLPVLDQHGRPLRNLRLSVTDRCNLRCGYCMPEEHYVWLPRTRLLRFGQLTEIVRGAVQLGTRKVRLTGGEPLLRRDLWRLVEQLRGVQGLEEIALTTNAVHLAEQAVDLARAGLDRVTVSLDTLRPERFRHLTRRDGLPRVLEGIEAARDAGLGPLKVNCVVVRGENDDELLELLDWARREGHELRLVEYMDVGGATRWSHDAVVPRAEILQRIAAAHGTPTPTTKEPSAPADRFVLPDGTVFGVIASTTEPFCGACDRARLTADGRLYTCLYGREGLDLSQAVRDGEDAQALARRMADAWTARTDRGAEHRLGETQRGALADAEELRRDPHLEMHTRGG